MDRRTRLRAAAAFGHGLHHECRFGGAQAAAAVFSRDRDPQPAAVSKGLVEIPGEFAGLIPFAPVLVREARAQRSHLFSDLFLFFAALKVHEVSSLLFLSTYHLPRPYRNSLRVWITWGKVRAGVSPRSCFDKPVLSVVEACPEQGRRGLSTSGCLPGHPELVEGWPTIGQ